MTAKSFCPYNSEASLNSTGTALIKSCEFRKSKSYFCKSKSYFRKSKR